MNRVEKIYDKVPVKNAIISVYDKNGIDTFARSLMETLPELRIYSTGNTFRLIEKSLTDPMKARLKKISDYTGNREMQGGLVKTLDYKIYLGLLSEPFNQYHEQDRSRAGAVEFDLVVINLYPFNKVISGEDTDAEDARSNIDIGGPCMLRASAKNYLRVCPVCDPADYDHVLKEMRENDGKTRLETRFSLAKKVFALSAEYDKTIVSYLDKKPVSELINNYNMV